MYRTYTINTIAADALAPWGARASAAMVLTLFSWYITVSTPVELSAKLILKHRNLHFVGLLSVCWWPNTVRRQGICTHAQDYLSERSILKYCMTVNKLWPVFNGSNPVEMNRHTVWKITETRSWQRYWPSGLANHIPCTEKLKPIHVSQDIIL